MARDPVEVVRDQYRATNERDFARAMEIYGDEVILVVTESWGVGSGIYVGKDAVGEWFGDWFRQFADDYHFDVDESRELAPGLVFLHATHRGHGRHSGVEVSSENAYLYRVSEGKIRRVGFFRTREEALDAASLPEWSSPQNG